jgi:hypothetical protein
MLLFDSVCVSFLALMVKLIVFHIIYVVSRCFKLIDVRLLWALLHHLSPSKAQMDNSSQGARQAWHQLVDTLEPVVHRLLTAIESSVVSSDQSSRAQAAVNCRYVDG